MASTARAEALEVLRTTPRRVETILRGVPRPHLHWPPAPGKWSLAEVLAHCEEMESAVYAATYASVGTAAIVDAPLFVTEVRAGAAAVVGAPPFDSDARALARGMPAEPAQELIRRWKRARREGLARLESFPESAWAAPVASAGRTQALEAFVAEHAAHDEAHVKQIEGILERQAILERLAGMPDELSSLLEFAAEPTEEMRRLVHRLVDEERRMLLAYARILEQERPLLAWLVCAPAPPPVPLPALAALRRELQKLRQATHALLYASAPRAWQRRGVDPRLGERTVAELVARQLDDDTQRLAALRALVTCAPEASPPR